jgi:hypothetical protein
MTLPVILLLLDIYPLRRLDGKLRALWTTAQREVCEKREERTKLLTAAPVLGARL